MSAKLIPAGSLRMLAGNLAGTCELLRNERSKLPRDDTYLYLVAGLHEIITLENAVKVIEDIAERRAAAPIRTYKPDVAPDDPDARLGGNDA